MSAWTLTAKKDEGKGGFAKAPAGNHLAVLVAVIDMGTQFSDGYQGAPGKWQRKAYFVWELIGEKADGSAHNHVIGTDLTLSLHEKAKLRKWLEARRGKLIPDGAPLEIDEELGQPCLLNVIEKNGYPKIDGLSAVPKGMPIGAPGYKPVAVSLDEFRANPAAVPAWVPYHFGKPIGDHVRECREMGGTAPAPQSGPTGATSGHDAGPRHLNTPATLEVFVDDDWQTLSQTAIAASINTGVFDPEAVFARTPGQKDKKNLTGWGFSAPGKGSEIPF